MDELSAKIKKLSGYMVIACQIQSVRDKGSVTRPQIAVMVGRPFGHIRIVRCKYRAVTVDLGLRISSDRL